MALGPTEYRMLEFFMTHPERVYTREQLLDRVWGGNVYVEERTIDVHIRRLRKALEDVEHVAPGADGARQWLSLLDARAKRRDARPRTAGSCSPVLGSPCSAGWSSAGCSEPVLAGIARGAGGDARLAAAEPATGSTTG